MVASFVRSAVEGCPLPTIGDAALTPVVEILGANLLALPPHNKTSQMANKQAEKQPEQNKKPKSKLWELTYWISHHTQQHLTSSRCKMPIKQNKTSPQAKRHKPSLLLTSLTILNSLTFITRQLFLCR